MKIVIVSDTHGSRKNIENVCECNPDADMLIHLGDVEDDEDYIEAIFELSLIHISEPTRLNLRSRMPSSA